VETANLGSALRRFVVDEHVRAPLAMDELRAEKTALIERVGSADSLRDFGGPRGVHGFYLIEGMRALGCSFAEMWPEHLQLNDFGRYWNYGFMHFTPALDAE
jgi:hypothetical protein